MLSRIEFIKVSLDVNLFFQRIMKEHMFFIETSLTPVEAEIIEDADILKKSMEGLLSESVILAQGAVSNEVLDSSEIVTPYTLSAENITSKLTGASIDTNITKAELRLVNNPDFNYSEWLEDKIFDLNCRTLNLLEEIIAFKKNIYNLVLECKIASTMYPHMIEHIIHEAELYEEILKTLKDKELLDYTICEELSFWNEIMEEHTEFINGLLDPTERKLKATAEDFSRIYERLLKDCMRCHKRDIVCRSLRATEELSDFKSAATEGILKCEIQSIIPPLLADHVYREANHYLRLLESLLK